MAHDVFVSYSADDKAVADDVTATLERGGVRCWIAPRDVLPGVVYSESIIGAINASRVLVLVFSGSSNASPHVMREVERAVNKRIPIIPLRIADVPLSQSMEYFISSAQWLDALTPPLTPYLAQLTTAVRRLLAAGEPVARDASPPVAPAQPVPVTPTVSARGTATTFGRPTRTSTARWAIGGALAALVAAILVVPSLLRGSPGAASSPGPSNTNQVSASGSSHLTTPSPSATVIFLPSTAPSPAIGPGVLGSFRSPGDTAAGLAWDGSHLWVSGSAELFKVELDGRVLGVYAPPSYTPEGLTWDGSRFLIFTTDASEIYRFSINEADPGSEPAIVGTIQPPSRTIGGTNHALAWEGSSLWFSESYSAYRLDSGGRVLKTLAFGEEIAGMAWDGSRLWLAFPNWPDPASIVAVDVDGTELYRFEAPLVEVSALGWVGDGQLLAAGTDETMSELTIYRIDVGAVP
jgi:hypothetical protein